MVSCGPNTLYCIMCNENIHRMVMYHQAYVWKNDVYMFVPLIKETTLIHEHSCDSIYSRQIRVFDALGRQHKVKSHFCQCEPEAVTLVRRGLWPATPKQPETAFTITLMELGRMLQLEGQLSLQKFCFALKRRTTFLPPHTTDCRNLYLALGNALTEFHHHQVSCLEMAHSPDILGKNCPECSDFQAGDMVRAKNKSANLDIKGVFGSVCHHGFLLYFVNMEHGERFAYPVYIMKQVASRQRCPELTGQLAERFKLVVPAFHSFAHNTRCQMTFGQQYCKGTGLIDGEAMERLWPYLRKFLWSKEMTLPNRQDLLSSALLNYGRRIFFSIVQTFSVRLKKARQIQVNSKVFISDVERKYDGNAVDWLHQLTQILVTNDDQRGTDPLIEKARKLSTERQHLLGLKKRYADGQKTAMRLTKRLHLNTSNLQAVGNKLREKGINILFAQLAGPKSAVYENNNHNLCREQVQAANSVIECCRAEE
ncbi:uncharacterized protein LOC112572443 isoform X2 [Pomacea canaliculata]|uniref:uncharacterized protein LOC112572443 isoform X2 n=1 Tax=Pomacea canaliculata TaxID=400727 RepID=UPI000D72C640|nr:uncharacterized protein LOC112572443 isoform X2 [Pomacea canaliculata]